MTHGNNGQPDRLHRTVAAVLDVDPTDLTDDSSPDSIPAWDSLNHLNIIMAIEGEFSIALSAEDALEMRSVGVIRQILSTHGVEA